MSYDRRRALKEVLGLYKRLENVDLGECFYCGESRECLDHVPPLVIVDKLNLEKYLSYPQNKLTLVPSCLECNSYLGSKKHFDPFERRIWLYEKLLKKIKFVTKWTKEELEEMGLGMKTIIFAEIEKYNKLAEKIEKISEKILELQENDDE